MIYLKFIKIMNEPNFQNTIELENLEVIDDPSLQSICEEQKKQLEVLSYQVNVLNKNVLNMNKKSNVQFYFKTGLYMFAIGSGIYLSSMTPFVFAFPKASISVIMAGWWNVLT